MAAKRGPESFAKRQRERQKQQKQMAKDARRRERNSAKKDAKLGTPTSTANLHLMPLGIVKMRATPPAGLR